LALLLELELRLRLLWLLRRGDPEAGASGPPAGASGPAGKSESLNAAATYFKWPCCSA
jgi:hypothetical protein